MRAASLAVHRPALLRIMVFVFVVSTSFDKFTFSFFRPTETFARVIGMVLVILFLVFLPSFKPKVRLFARELQWFYIFAAVTAIEELLLLTSNSALPSEFSGYLAYLQLFALMFILQDLTRDARIYRTVLVAALASYSVMSVLTAFNLATVSYVGTATRVGVVGVNFNTAAYFYAVVAVCLVSWMFAEGNVHRPAGLAKLILLAFLFLGIARSGSRGGTAALAAGLLVTALVNIRAKRLPRYFLFVPALVAGLAYFLLARGVVAERWTETINYGDTGFRGRLLETGLSLAKQKPLLGYGTMYGRPLGNMLGFQNIAAHDTYLQIILSFGVVGLVPFLIGLFMLAKVLWRRRNSVWGGMWLSVLVMTLAFGTVGHLGDTKTLWILVTLLANVDVMITAPPWTGRLGGTRHRSMPSIGAMAKVGPGRGTFGCVRT